MSKSKRQAHRTTDQAIDAFEREVLKVAKTKPVGWIVDPSMMTAHHEVNDYLIVAAKGAMVGNVDLAKGAIQKAREAWRNKRARMIADMMERSKANGHDVDAQPWPVALKVSTT